MTYRGSASARPSVFASLRLPVPPIVPNYMLSRTASNDATGGCVDSHPGTARRSREWPRSHDTGWECCEHPCLPALLKCGFREMPPREEKESHRRGVTHVLCLRSTSRIWGFMQPSPDRAIVAWVSAQGARRCVCAPAVVCVAVGGRGPGAAREGMLPPHKKLRRVSTLYFPASVTRVTRPQEYGFA